MRNIGQPSTQLLRVPTRNCRLPAACRLAPSPNPLAQTVLGGEDFGGFGAIAKCGTTSASGLLATANVRCIRVSVFFHGGRAAASLPEKRNEVHLAYLDLTIAGGYFTLPGFAACSFQARSADFTQIDGAGNKAPLYIETASVESSVSDLAVQNAVSVNSVPPLRIHGSAP